MHLFKTIIPFKCANSSEAILESSHNAHISSFVQRTCSVSKLSENISFNNHRENNILEWIRQTDTKAGYQN